MKLLAAGSIVFLSTLLLAFTTAAARPAGPREDITVDDPVTDVVGDVEGRFGTPRKALADTIWIATWTFDGPGGCDDTGWEKVDNRIINDGQIHWNVEGGFGGTGGMVGNAAVLGYTGVHCCAEPDGYDNDWYEAIRLQYVGNATLSFQYLLDSETGFDFLQVETDSSCASFARVDYAVAPASMAANYRDLVFNDDGYVTAGTVVGLGLTNYGPGTHCVYIAFFSDGGFSPCDGEWPSTLGRALVVDNVQLADASGTTTEDFEGTVDPGLFIGLHDSTPFGEWARLYRHITDNDACTENTTCAWLWTDYTTPTFANDPSMAFGPNGYVVRSWLSDMIVSPWVSLASTPSASGTVFSFKRFGGNPFNTSHIQHNWAVRGHKNVAGQDCISGWGHAFQSNTLEAFAWRTFTVDMTPFFDSGSEAIQIRHRVRDRQVIGDNPPIIYRPGPGPYIDDTRIGRVVLSGPVLSEGSDARSQAQDGFPTEIHPGITPGTGEHFRPTADRFGTCAFSQGADLGQPLRSPNLIPGDSVTVSVKDARNAGSVSAVEWYGTIVSGPHAGKAPAPYTVGSNGFFAVTADSARNNSGAVVEGTFFVDLDDTYFRGGDVLQYFWLATDAMGGTTSDPSGLGALPASVDTAEHATGGLLEVSFLPAIDWDPAYLARIAADAHGDLAPTQAELAGSSQKHCILYVNHMNTRRRSGAVNRTTFMYTLDRLGYEYDVYDHSGMGNTNNHLGGRATVPQATGYSLIVYDAGDGVPGRPILPTGINNDTEKVDQDGWFRSWLAQAVTSEAGVATLWVIGSNAVEEKSGSSSLLYPMMGATLAHTSQTAAVNPAVEGQTSFTFDTGTGSAAVDFTTGDRALFMLAAGCATPRSYDGLGITGTGVPVYRYRAAGVPPSDAALVMNSDPGAHWNTILQSHPWFHIHDPSGAPPTAPGPARDLAGAILAAVVPGCAPGVPVDVPRGPVIEAPSRTALLPNVPNPFNPMTEIRFDLAQSGRVRLRIYDVAGGLVRTLVDADMDSGFGKRLLWNGLDAAGVQAPSGLYFARLDAPDRTETRKMLLLR